MLSFPLAPQHAARLLARVLGGKGSGNFGHAGRPGEIGGSAPDSLPIPPLAPDAVVYPGYVGSPQKALTNYTETANTNFQIRRNLLDSNVVEDDIRQIDALMTPLERETTVYRVVNRTVLDALNIGDVFQDTAYVSTTQEPLAVPDLKKKWRQKGQELATVEIHLRNNQRHVDVNAHIRRHPWGSFGLRIREMILPRGSKFEVIGRTETKTGVKFVLKAI